MTEPAEVPRKDIRPSLPVALAASAVFVVTSFWLLWLSAHDDPSVHAPLIVVIGVAMMFLSASAMMVLSAIGKERYQDHLVAVLMGGFTVAFVGIGLFGDPRYCSGSLLLLLPCRPAFGAFGIFFGFVTVMLIQRVLRRYRRPRSYY